METRGLGAGSYPEPPEDENKWFKVVVEGTFESVIEVQAKDITEAVNRVQNMDYEDEIMTNYDIEDIKECEEI